MNNKSFWKNNINNKLLEQLNSDIETEILIIGGGIAGLSIAYFLKDTNYKITLIERNSCGLGITSHSSAKITFVQEDIYHKLNKDIAPKYLDSQILAIKLLKEIINKNNISCDLESSPSYLFTETESKIDQIKQEEKFYKDNHINYLKVDKLPINFPCKYAIKIDNNYTFNPVKYLLALKDIVKKKIKIYENTPAINMIKEDNYYKVLTPQNKIKAKIVIVATHYPFFTKPLFIPFKTNVEESFLLLSKMTNLESFNAINTTKPTHSFRNVTMNNLSYLLYVNTSHLITSNYNKEKLLEISINHNKKYLDNETLYYFTNQDIITIDNIPYIGKIKDNLFIATGFNTWGMTNGTISGKVISDIILNNENSYQDLFNPKRIPYNITKLIIYNFNNAKSLMISKIKQNYSFYRDKVKIVYENNKRIGVYSDDDGREHKTLNTCPHLKCNLIFNKVEKTWDCPCHGSKFDYDGNIIYGPSNHNIKYPK